MLETIGVAKSGRYVLAPKEEELYTNWLIDCDGKFVKAKWTRVGKPKTDKQLATHFALATAKVRQAMIDQGQSILGVTPNKVMVHEMLSMSCGGVGPLGEMKRLSQMTSSEAHNFFENIRDWAAKNLHIVIPDPDPRWKEKSS
jgi:hypothetical protein